MTVTRLFPKIGIALVTLAILAGCTSGGAPPTSLRGSRRGRAVRGCPVDGTGRKTYKDLTIGFIQTGSEGGWRAANTASFKDTAEELGINLKFYDAQNKLENQLSAFRNFIADDEVDVIILAALEAAGWDQVLQEAKDAGKIVVLEDRRIDAPETYTPPTSAPTSPKRAARPRSRCANCSEGSAKKNVVELVGNVGSSAAIDRGKGFREKMGDCGITITETQTGDWDATKGKSVTEAFLQKSKDSQGVFAQNDEMGLGAIQALKEAGLKPATDVKIITVDATRGAFEAMIAGDINTVVECNPLLAPQVYEAALKAVNGEKLPTWVPSIESVFYQADAAKILPTRAY